jgi:hypothetical protein
MKLQHAYYKSVIQTLLKSIDDMAGRFSMELLCQEIYRAIALRLPWSEEYAL